VAGLREVFTVADPWMMCGVEDLLRYIYPQVSRPQHLEFRYKERHGDTTSSRPSYDWVVLRLIAVAVYESLATMDAGAQSTPPLAVVRRWQTLSRASREPSHTPTWWGWLVETVDAHCENVGHTFPLRRPPNPRWREQYMRPQLAIPTADAFAALEAWAHTPLASLLADPTGSERWASRFSMLSQFLDEAKEDALGVLLAKI
jgi:hypothetical protein